MVQISVLFWYSIQNPKNWKTFPHYILKGSTADKYLYLSANYPAKSKELYLGYYPTDLITRTKIDEVNVHSHNVTPNFRSKPNPKYLKLIMDKFNRSRHGTHQLFSEKGILTPNISVRIYKTLQRSTLLYAIEFCDWDVDQVKKLEILQAKALRSYFDTDLQGPQSILRLVAGVEPFEARRDLHVLMYYCKLCRSTPNSLLGKIHRYRTENLSEIQSGFHQTVFRTLDKYKIGQYWNNVPDGTRDELKLLLKKTIWLFHWKQDMANALTKNTPFSMILPKPKAFLTFPYKSNKFHNQFSADKLCSSRLASVMRFWLTPSRSRVCSCEQETNCLMKHLIFECPKTRLHMSEYKRNIPNTLKASLSPTKLPQFFKKLTLSEDLRDNFNRLAANFDYPRY